MADPVPPPPPVPTPAVLQAGTHARHRMAPGADGSIDSVLHLARYEWAAEEWIDESDRVVDLGCGTGYGLDVLARRAREVVGVDLTISEAAALVDESSSRLSLVEADIAGSDLLEQLAPASFAVVTSMEVIEHLEDYFTFAANAAALVAPHGTVVIGTPNRRLTYERYPDRRHMDPSHVQEFTTVSLRRTLEACFDDVALHYQHVPGYWPATPPTPIAGRPPAPRRLTSLRPWLPRPPEKVLAAIRARRADPPRPGRRWTVDDVRFVPVEDAPELAGEAFGIIAVCHAPRRA